MSEIVVKRSAANILPGDRPNCPSIDTANRCFPDCGVLQLREVGDTECRGAGRKGCPLNDGPITVRLEEV